MIRPMNKKDLMTAEQLADLLRPYGDLPVKLRTIDTAHEEPCCVTLIEHGAIDVTRKNGQDTLLGDIDLVVIDLHVSDNS